MNHKITVISLIAALICIPGKSQDLSYSKPGSTFREMANPRATDTKDWAKTRYDVNVSYASDNVRYPKERVPILSEKTTWNATGWKGEKVHTQILVWTKKEIPSLSFQLEDLVDDYGNHIPESTITASFVRYVMTDDFGGACADRDLSVDDSLLVSDPLDIVNQLPVEANTVQPIWLSIRIPGNVPAGKYTGTLIVKALNENVLKISLNVLEHTLPPPDQWKYDLDLWQYPAPIARIHDVELWSDEHFQLMRPYFETLAGAGQKVITANIIEQPWGLDHVHFDDPSLVKWTKKKNGSWTYDFSMFDRYVSFVMSCGITQRINCYSMITWDLSFIYYDEATGENNSIKLEPVSSEYNDYWSGMIEEFTKYLKKRGWFHKTAIAVDERPVESMQAIIALLKKADPEWKIALAGDSYHPEIEQDIYDYCLASYLRFEDEVMIQRKAEGKPTTYYTACPEHYPNGYTFSPPAENAWLGWYASAKGYTGYLFWAYNTWVANPLLDSRWKRYPAGSLFQFYPGPRTSIRFEKLIEGIQAFEKIRILREEFEKEGSSEKIKELDDMLATFELVNLESIPAAATIENAKEVLNKY